MLEVTCRACKRYRGCAPTSHRHCTWYLSRRRHGEYNDSVRQCVVSIRGTDGQEHSIDTEAESLFGAAYAGVHEWAKMWWFSSDLIIEVRADDTTWRVKAARASAWYAEQFWKPR